MGTGVGKGSKESRYTKRLFFPVALSLSFLFKTIKRSDVIKKGNEKENHYKKRKEMMKIVSWKFGNYVTSIACLQVSISHDHDFKI